MTAPAFRRPPDGRLIPTPTPRPRWYTAQEVAAILRISRMSVYRHFEEWGGVRIGRLVRIPAAAIDALVAGER